ncbi:flavin reductase family protein [Catelliglobosispora koreensis]|uniref:flavin reductase family protein n=1 Tax=Catelliglobosispora koreensis TaxID=129052 RepID=UPI000382B30F
MKTDLKVLYFGTPVVLISTRNEDGTANLAPMSSAWWLGQEAVLGMGNSSQTTANLARERECVLNLVPSSLVSAIDNLAMTTGKHSVPEGKARMGYRHVADKFAHAGLNQQASELVWAPRVRQCPIQLEAKVTAIHPVGDLSASTIHVKVLRAHVEQELIIPGTHYVDPEKWDPLIMKFCEFFGDGRNVAASRLAEGWQMPHAAVGLSSARV